MLKVKLSLGILTLALTPLAAPFLARSHPLFAFLIRSFFSGLCHQDPARSFMVEGSPAAVCVRCLGIYCGAALAPLLRVVGAPARRLLAMALLLNLLDGVSAEPLLCAGQSAPAAIFVGGVAGGGSGSGGAFAAKGFAGGSWSPAISIQLMRRRV